MFYLEFFDALAHYQVAYALVGGLAVSLYGVARATMDIDIVVGQEPENLADIEHLKRVTPP